jgi:hypothetical protein
MKILHERSWTWTSALPRWKRAGSVCSHSVGWIGICPRGEARQAWPMTRGRGLCAACRDQVSVTAGMIVQDSHLPLTIWFRTMWDGTSQKTGVSALGGQRVLGWAAIGPQEPAPQVAASYGAARSGPTAWSGRGG